LEHTLVDTDSGLEIKNSTHHTKVLNFKMWDLIEAVLKGQLD
jgi:hypothetical protein